MFGVGNLAALGHMGTIMNRRLVVDASGDEAYTRNPERIQVPVLLVQGERNYIFRPAGSMRTLRWLQTANEPSLYERAVLPGYAPRRPDRPRRGLRRVPGAHRPPGPLQPVNPGSRPLRAT